MYTVKIERAHGAMGRYRCVVFVAIAAVMLLAYMALHNLTISSATVNSYGEKNVKQGHSGHVTIEEIINKNDIKVLPTEAKLRMLSRREVSQIYHDYVNTVQISCDRIIRSGNKRDGGWDLCVDPPYQLTAPCLIYSFGINYDFSFDDDVANKHGCEVHSYDPSMDRVGNHLRGQRVHFHKTGLNNSDVSNENRWRMRRFSSILKENSHVNDIIDVLKIDIECSELWALPEMLTSGSLRNVKQLCFEMHIKRIFQPEPDKEKYIFGLSIFRNLYREGFRIFKSHRNMYPKYKSIYGMVRTGCHEIYMIREL